MIAVSACLLIALEGVHVGGGLAASMGVWLFVTASKTDGFFPVW